MTRRPTVATALLFAVSLGLPWHSASAQTYPDKPVRIVVPYVAGGNLDVTTRLFAEGLATELGQPFFVENRPGANGNTGTAQVARTPPDGYTLAMVSVGLWGAQLGANHCAAKYAATQPASDSTSSTKPRHRPISTDSPWKASVSAPGR